MTMLKRRAVCIKTEIILGKKIQVTQVAGGTIYNK